MSGANPGTIAVGLVGAGPWAAKAYAPMLAAGPETRLAAVWSRRPEAAVELASAHGSEPAATFDALLEHCDAVAFAVPPDIQADLAVRAARAGRHLLLDKPLSLTVEAAQRVVDEVEGAGVVTQLMLTHRFREPNEAFLDEARRLRPATARFRFLCGAFLDGPYATPWRREHGALFDLGPHAFDLVEAVMGPIERVEGVGHPRDLVMLTGHHAGGGFSEIALSGDRRLPRTICSLQVYTPSRTLELDAVSNAHIEVWSAVRSRFADAVRTGRAPALDARRGLHLQHVIDMGQRALGLS